MGNDKKNSIDTEKTTFNEICNLIKSNKKKSILTGLGIIALITIFFLILMTHEAIILTSIVIFVTAMFLIIKVKGDEIKTIDYCKYCNTEFLNDNALYCHKCGAKRF